MTDTLDRTDEWRERNHLTKLTVNMDWEMHGKFSKKTKQLLKKSNRMGFVIRLLVAGWLDGHVDIMDLKQKLEDSKISYFVGNGFEEDDE